MLLLVHEMHLMLLLLLLRAHIDSLTALQVAGRWLADVVVVRLLLLLLLLSMSLSMSLCIAARGREIVVCTYWLVMILRANRSAHVAQHVSIFSERFERQSVSVAGSAA